MHGTQTIWPEVGGVHEKRAARGGIAGFVLTLHMAAVMEPSREERAYTVQECNGCFGHHTVSL